jgi:pimeloyl-ACP methyl ester carboxylesterase
VLLIHGFPQTNYQFRRVITPISDAGYTVIAPDYRGAGASGKPVDGYDKATMSKDLHSLIKNVLGINDPIHVVGHDIGAMVAHAYAIQFPEDVASLCIGEAAIPGTTAYHERKISLLAWHWSFHSVPDLPESLVEGRERMYLKHFYDRLGQNPDAISSEDLGVYAQAYSQPGGMRAGFNVYRTFEQDSEQNDAWLKEKGKSAVKVLSLWGETSYANESQAIAMLKTYYQSVEFAVITGAGHWVAEEKPGQFAEKVLAWVGRHS